jgi:hypothetical protein
MIAPGILLWLAFEAAKSWSHVITTVSFVGEHREKITGPFPSGASLLGLV